MLMERLNFSWGMDPCEKFHAKIHLFGGAGAGNNFAICEACFFGAKRIMPKIRSR